MDYVALFSKGALDSGLGGSADKTKERLLEWPADALLAAPIQDVIDELVDIATVRCPVLLRDQVWLKPPVEEDVTFREFGETFTRRVTKHVLVVPFEGESIVLQVRANHGSFSPPRVERLAEGEFHISAPAGGDGAAIRANLDAQLDKIETYLSWSRAEIERHNAHMISIIPGMVRARREALLASRNTQAEIGFPIRRRPAADTYTVPIKRRRIEPVRGSSNRRTSPFKPEPAMADTDFQDALSVLRRSRNALERTPSLAAKLDEEEIRDVLLVNLNDHFEGEAAGEVFNGYGKTDILIRVDDRNIFIGECKVWDGPATMDDALKQLFDYLVWRDTKAAILLFIRRVNVTDVIRKAVAKIEAHPNYKRPAPPPAEGEHAFVMHAQDDPEREIHLALLPFALRAPRATP